MWSSGRPRGQTQQNGSPVSGSYYIGGLNGTTINGRAGYTATGVTRDFNINMKGGGDSLLLGPDPTLSHPSSDKFIVSRDLNVDMGSSGTEFDHFGSTTFYANGITVGHNAVINSGYAHDDHFYIRGNFLNDVKISSVADNTYVTMWDDSVSNDPNIGASSGVTSAINIRQEISLYTMNVLHNATVTHNFAIVNRDVAGDLVYDDIDTVSVDKTFTINSNISHNQIYLENVTQHDLNVYMFGFDYGGDNNNRLDLKHVDVDGTAWLIGGVGNDRFDLQGTFDALLVYGRTGNDTVLIHDSLLGSLGITEASRSYQHDVISLSNNYIVGNASVYTGSGNDTISVDTVSVYKRLTIDTGAGEDNVSITKSAADELFALLGAGDDTLSLTTVRARSSILDGGDGTNSLYLAGDIALAVYKDATRFQRVRFPWQA